MIKITRKSTGKKVQILNIMITNGMVLKSHIKIMHRMNMIDSPSKKWTNSKKRSSGKYLRG